MVDYDWLGPMMFVGALVFLGWGYPVAFSLGGVAILFAIIGAALGSFDPIFLSAMPQRIFGIMANGTLLAIPFFIFLGSMLERSGIAEQLLETMGIILGHLRGGLALAVILVGTMLAATTGVVAATVVAMGLISLPIMLRYGYSKELASGVIVASGTLGQIIPPSVVLIVLADQLGVSVGDLFIGSLLPGLMMAGSFAIYVLIIAWLKPNLAPALPAEVRNIGGQELRRRIVQVMLPPLILILLVLGSIFFGIASPTEAGAVGSIGAIALALANQKLTWQSLWQVCDATLRITSMVMLILLGSTAFSLVFRGLEGDRFMFDILANLPGGQMGFLAVSMLTIFILGFFIDFFEIAFIVLPLFKPVAEALNLDLIWYGVIVGANLQTSFLTPPFGFALFYLRGVAPPSLTTGQIYRGALPFIALQILVLLLIIIFPPLVNWLPSLSAN
ncbi:MULTISPECIES: TRAP transporter large permease [Synechocystis]|uniref:TRAP transporter large permease subunit n=2 Tax=Synechocystis TaxID=1142 RepID=A0ABR9VLX1_9SYNC|nr:MULTISPECIES: TRAP transporter large permease subunit [Synechocystis]MBD2652231.1 TRAP transporter large permease subunit [Synechocystis sp. FACHB-383]MBE9239489.1 TRAP transporter large permease subunit [Synechocystis salina LEGE 00041]MBE9252339.1 TRAP transporter large permease subunit [Synechocystis salina LEGE 00031]